MKQLKALVRFLETHSLSYNQEAKDRFKTIGLATMRKLAKELKLKTFEASFNAGGIAVAGDLHLMGMFNDNVGIYFSITDGSFARNSVSIMFRTIKHMKDYSGGSNQWMSGDEFSDLENVKRLVYRACGVSESDLVGIKPKNAVKPATTIKQKAGKFDQAEFDRIAEKYSNHFQYGNYFRIDGSSKDRIDDLTYATLAYKKHVTTKAESNEFLYQKFTFIGGKGTVEKLLNAYRPEIWDIFNPESGRYEVEDLWQYEENLEEEDN